MTRRSGIQLKGDGFSVAELSLKTPMVWSGASFRAGDIQALGRKLVVNRKNRMEISAKKFASTERWIRKRTSR